MEHFSDELSALHALEDDAAAALADLQSYISEIDICADDEEDADDGDEIEEAGAKEPTLKDVKAYLKAQGTDEANVALKEIKKLEADKNRLSRDLKKKTVELQEKIDTIRQELTADQCEVLVMQLLHESFVAELEKYLSAELAKTVSAVTHLWEKYYVSASTLLDERQAAENKLHGFLRGLGYYE
jgi:type I restriction enzyme M protein